MANKAIYIILNEKAYNKLKQYSKESKLSMTEVVNHILHTANKEKNMFVKSNLSKNSKRLRFVPDDDSLYVLNQWNKRDISSSQTINYLITNSDDITFPEKQVDIKKRIIFSVTDDTQKKLYKFSEKNEFSVSEIINQIFKNIDLNAINIPDKKTDEYKTRMIFQPNYDTAQKLRHWKEKTDISITQLMNCLINSIEDIDIIATIKWNEVP